MTARSILLTDTVGRNEDKPPTPAPYNCSSVIKYKMDEEFHSQPNHLFWTDRLEASRKMLLCGTIYDKLSPRV